MTRYTIEVSEEEAKVVALALGRMVSPKPIRERKPVGPKRHVHRVPKMNDRTKATLEKAWARDVKLAEEFPGQVRADGFFRARQAVGAALGHRTAEDLEKAWGITS